MPKQPNRLLPQTRQTATFKQIRLDKNVRLFGMDLCYENHNDECEYNKNRTLHHILRNTMMTYKDNPFRAIARKSNHKFP